MLLDSIHSLPWAALQAVEHKEGHAYKGVDEHRGHARHTDFIVHEGISKASWLVEEHGRGMTWYAPMFLRHAMFPMQQNKWWMVFVFWVNISTPPPFHPLRSIPLHWMGHGAWCTSCANKQPMEVSLHFCTIPFAIWIHDVGRWWFQVQFQSCRKPQFDFQKRKRMLVKKKKNWVQDEKQIKKENKNENGIGK